MWTPRLADGATWRAFEVLEEAAPSARKAIEDIQDLRRFVRAQGEESLQRVPREVVYGLAAAQMRVDGMLPSSIEGRVRNWRSWQVNPTNTEAAVLRIEANLVLGGLARTAARVGVTHIKPLYDTPTMEALIRHRLTDEYKDVRYRFLCTVALMSGGRMKHVREARSVVFQERGVAILWGPRKVRVETPTTPIVYEYGWAGVELPRDVKILSKALRGKVPVLGTGETIAGCVDAWARRRNPDQKITTGCFRVFFLQVVGRMVEQREMTENMFEMLCDQRYATFLLKYRR